MESKDKKTSRMLLRPSNLFGGEDKRDAEECPARTRSRSQDIVRDTKCDLEAVETRLWNLNGLMTHNNETFQFRKEDFLLLESLGSGACSTVFRAQHRIRRHCVTAVKQMYRSTCQLEENRRIARDLEVITQCHDCPFIVQCYGVLITGLEVWICMEVMTTCLEKLLDAYKNPFPEDIVGVITVCIVRALNYLKTKHQVMHRDLKPSNILLNEDGAVKLCDFGISSRLHCSVALSVEKGCAGYLAPERVDSDYCDVRADVWSLGLTLYQLATVEFPYQGTCCFEVLSRITHDPPPRLVEQPPLSGVGPFSSDLCHFVNLCLTKDVKLRPKYDVLMQTRFFQSHEANYYLVRNWFRSITGLPPMTNGNNNIGKDGTSVLNIKSDNHQSNSTILSADSGCVPSPISGPDAFSTSRSSSNRSQAAGCSIASPGSCASSTPRDTNDSVWHPNLDTSNSPLPPRNIYSLLPQPHSGQNNNSQCQLLPSYLPYQGSISAPLPQYRVHLREQPNDSCGSDCVSPRHRISPRPSQHQLPPQQQQQQHLTGQPPLFCFYTSVSPRQQRIQHICGQTTTTTSTSSFSYSNLGGETPRNNSHSQSHLYPSAPTRPHQHMAYVAATPPANRRHITTPRFSSKVSKPPLTLSSQRSLPKGHFS